MSPITQLNGSVIYRPMVIDLAAVTVPTKNLRAPTADQRTEPSATVGVNITFRDISFSQAILPAHRNDDLFVFGETLDQNTELVEIIKDRQNRWINLAPATLRAGTHVAKTAGLGLAGGAIGGAIVGLIFFPPSAGLVFPWGASIIGAGATGVIAGAAGAVDAWRAESATIRLIDLIYNYNKLWKNIYEDDITENNIARSLNQLYKASIELGGAGPQLFAEVEDILSHDPTPRQVAIYQQFNAIRDR